MSLKDWPALRYEHATGDVLTSCSALEARLRDTAGALRELTECHADGGYVQPDADVLDHACKILARLKEEGLT